MSPELTERQLPQPDPETPGPEVRMSRLHEALKQLKARGSAPLSAVQAELAKAPAEADRAPAPAIAMESAAKSPPAVASPVMVAASTAAETAANVPSPAVEPVTAAAAPVHAPPLGELHSRPYRIEDWSLPARLQRFRQLAESIAREYPHGLSAAVGLAAADPWQNMADVASRLALCLAEREEGEVLLIERDLATRDLSPAAPAWGLADLAVGRATCSQAAVPTSAARLSLLAADSAVPQEDPPISEQWRSTMKQLKQRFRYIVSAIRLDNPGPDPWLASFDAVYLAVAFHSTSQAAAAATLARLKAAGANACGCIALN